MVTMAKTYRRTPDSNGVKVRSFVAIAAWQRNSAGVMGTTKRNTAKRSRQAAKADIRRGEF